MIKFRSRLLITLILAAVALAALGAGPVWAKARSRSSTVGGKYSYLDKSYLRYRSPIGSYSGEPDAGSGSLPKTQPTSGTPPTPTNTSVLSGDFWLLFWAIWVMRQ